MARSDARARVLVAILVYNGREFVPACLESVARMRSEATHDVDVLVLDDCSPDPGWGEELAGRCRVLDVLCYRSPRNLGIPRNMNLAVLWALSRSYDHLLLLNSDVVVPGNLVDVLVEVARTEPSTGSVTAWSNNASVYSVPNDGSDPFLSRRDVVDWAATLLHDEFGAQALEVPTGVGFCMLVPTGALRHVGLLDPVYGRGYCEEVDWNLRAGALGYRSLLALGTFVFHRGQGSTIGAGLIGMHQTSDAHHERILDLRHPQYRSQLVDFVCSGVMPPLKERGLRALIRGAAREWGYTVEATALSRPKEDGAVWFVGDPGEGAMAFTGHFAGFSHRFDVASDAPLATLVASIGRLPDRVAAFERGPHAAALAEESQRTGVPFLDLASYPERV